MRNRVCELTIIDSFLKQYMYIVYRPPLFLMSHDALHISDTRLCILRSERELHRAGRERSGTVGYCAGRDGNGFQFDCNSRERDGNGFISKGRDGTGYAFHSRVPLYFGCEVK